MNGAEIISLCLFLFLLSLILLFDLGVFNKEEKDPDYKQSLIRTGIWVLLAFGFFVFLWFNGSVFHGIQNAEELRNLLGKYQERQPVQGNSFASTLEQYNHDLGLSFLNGYFVEYSLSMDNILVIILIFTSFKVERKYYHKVLFWGIIGAVALRALFIFIGTTLIQHFHWVLYIFGAFLIFSGTSMFIKRNEEESMDSDTHPVVRWLSKIFPLEKNFHEDRFFIRKENKNWITPLFLVLMVIEFSDLIFAVDSIPAVFSITRDPYIVFFSNIFAIMGLRSLFFLMEGIVDRFHYLKTGLAILLVLVGFKMLFPGFFERIGFSNTVSLFTILGILGGSILISLWVTGRREKSESIRE